MASAYSTAGVDSSRQLLKWQQIMGDVYYAVNIVGDRKHGIRGELMEQTVDRISITRFDSDRQRVLRTRENISRDGDDSYVIVFPETGSLYYEHLGRSGFLDSGSYVVVRSSEYYELACPDNFRNTTIRIPSGALESEYPQAWDHCANRYRGTSDFAAIVRGFAQSIWSLNDATRLQLGGELSTEMTRLVAILLRSESNPDILGTPSAKRSTSYLYREILSQIRSHRAETPLSAKQVALQLRISCSYVNKILAEHNTSFGKVLKEAHLQIAYEMLCDPRMQNLSIKEVMYRAGFTNFSHFCYAFKTQFGRTAGEVRQGKEVQFAAMADPVAAPVKS